jgi:uncharacterized membrane protein
MLMNYRLPRVWDNLQSSLWFVPSLLVGSLIVLAFLFTWVDRLLGPTPVTLLPVFPEAGAAAAREMLSIIASSSLTVASVAFSFTIVVFSFASAQYSSRTLRTFMDDNVNQVVLGVLLGSFVYCTIVLRSTRLEEQTPVPELSVSFALVLALANLVLFIVYIHHVAESIQAYSIIKRLSDQTIKSVAHLFPSNIGTDATGEPDADHFSMPVDAGAVRANRSGYIQIVDGGLLMRVVTRQDLRLVLEKGVGSFVVKGEPLAYFAPPDHMTQNALRDLEYAFVLGEVRTIFQDSHYGLLQLSDVAVKALSPAINDPNTAIMSLNQIANVLRHVARAQFPGPFRCDPQGRVRVFAFGQSFEMLVAQGFDQIRRHASLDVAVLIKMLDAISEIADHTQDLERLSVLKQHVLAVKETCALNVTHSRDLTLFNHKLEMIAGVMHLSADESAPLEHAAGLAQSRPAAR